jgi:MFS family permease
VETRVAREPAAVRAWTWYVVAVGAWFLAIGLNQVIVPALVTQELRAGGGSLASAQTAGQLPTLLLILLGGAVADRADRRRVLLGLYLAASALTAGLAARVAGGGLSLPLVIAYVASMGVLSAFLMPARDSLLSELAYGDLMRSVSLLTVAQWGMQAIGSFAARAGERVGVAALISAQAAIVLAGAAAVWRLPRAARSDSPPRALSLHELAEGVREVARSPVLRPIALLAIALGVLFIGPFLVVFPLMVRDYYGGDTTDLSMLFGCFPLGIITCTLWLIARRGLRRKGRAQLAALANGALCMGALGLGLPFWGALATVFAFGIGGAVFMNASRTLFQEKAPPAHRGRVLSVYSLATMGSSGVIGAPLSGVVVSHFGPLTACTVSGAAMLAVVIGFLAATRVSELE